MAQRAERPHPPAETPLPVLSTEQRPSFCVVPRIYLAPIAVLRTWVLNRDKQMFRSPEVLSPRLRGPSLVGSSTGLDGRACALFACSCSGLSPVFPKKPCGFGRYLGGLCSCTGQRPPAESNHGVVSVKVPEGPVPSTLPKVGRPRKRSPPPQQRQWAQHRTVGPRHSQRQTW